MLWNDDSKMKFSLGRSLPVRIERSKRPKNLNSRCCSLRPWQKVEWRSQSLLPAINSTCSIYSSTTKKHCLRFTKCCFRTEQLAFTTNCSRLTADWHQLHYHRHCCPSTQKLGTSTLVKINCPKAWLPQVTERTTQRGIKSCSTH